MIVDGAGIAQTFASTQIGTCIIAGTRSAIRREVPEHKLFTLRKRMPNYSQGHRKIPAGDRLDSQNSLDPAKSISGVYRYSYQANWPAKMACTCSTGTGRVK